VGQSIIPDFKVSQRCRWRFECLCLSHGIERWTVIEFSNEHIVFIFRVQSKKSGLFVTEYEDITVLRNTGNCLPVDEAWLQSKRCTHRLTAVREARSYWASVSPYQCLNPEPIASCIPTSTVVILLLVLDSRTESLQCDTLRCAALAIFTAVNST